MSFIFPRIKKDLDITDALKRKEAEITIGGKPVVIKALKLAEALELFSALGDLKTVINLAQNDTVAFNRLLLAKLPAILRFCVPDRQMSPGDVTLTEFADLIMAVWCVNDLGRILANFTRAIPQELIIMPTGAVLPKR